MLMQLLELITFKGFFLCLGRGVVATSLIQSKQFILEYTGELISSKEGDLREAHCQTGYRYFFGHQNLSYWSV